MKPVLCGLVFFMPSTIGAEELRIPSTLEATGTHLEIRDSEYLSIVMDSSESVNILL